MNVYFDTSALVKLLVLEPGSDLAEGLWERADLRMTGLLSYPEARAALAAAVREGRLERRVLGRLMSDLDEMWAALRIIGVDEQLARFAGQLAETHALRGYDAVHLACALSVANQDLLVATWDADLARASVAAGRPVVPKG